MKLSEAIEELDVCKSWEEFALDAEIAEARLALTRPCLTDAEWAKWDEAKDRTRTRLANLMGAG